MSKSFRREPTEHGELIQYGWTGDSGKFSINTTFVKSGDGCVSLKKEYMYWYPSELRDMGAIFLMLAREHEAKERALKKEWNDKVNARIPVTTRWARAGHAIKQGKAVQSYWLDGDEAWSKLAKEKYPSADAYVTERNGDCIIMIVPKGTPADKLPLTAKEYLCFGWNKA